MKHAADAATEHEKREFASVLPEVVDAEKRWAQEQEERLKRENNNA